MSVGRPARTGLLVVAALLTGLVGPCVCGPTAAVSQASHGCCDEEAGLKPAPLDCCAGCSVSLRASDAGLVRDVHPCSIPAPSTRVTEPILQPTTASLSWRLPPFVVPSPPAILRV